MPTVDPNNQDQVDVVLATIRQVESSNNYTVPPNSAQASGAYQFLPSTWADRTKMYGIGTQYKNAYEAPPWVQDEIAKLWVQDILKSSRGDVAAVPGAWNPAAGASYVSNWLGKYKYMLDSGIVIDTTHALGTDTPTSYANPESTGYSPTGLTSDAYKAVKDNIPNPLKGIEAVGAFFNTLGKSGTWVRVAYVVGGLALVGFGVFAIANRNGAVTTVVKGVAA